MNLHRIKPDFDEYVLMGVVLLAMGVLACQLAGVLR